MDIKKKVEKIINDFGTNNPFRLCKYFNISVIFCELGNIKGYSVKKLRRKVICINSKLNDFDKRLVCAHELGHCLFHQVNDINFFLKNTNIIRNSILEKEANKFAVELLFDDFFLAYIETSSIRSEFLNEIAELKYLKNNEI